MPLPRCRYATRRLCSSSWMPLRLCLLEAALARARCLPEHTLPLPATTRCRGTLPSACRLPPLPRAFTHTATHAPPTDGSSIPTPDCLFRSTPDMSCSPPHVDGDGCGFNILLPRILYHDVLPLWTICTAGACWSSPYLATALQQHLFCSLPAHLRLLLLLPPLPAYHLLLLDAFRYAAARY